MAQVNCHHLLPAMMCDNSYKYSVGLWKYSHSQYIYYNVLAEVIVILIERGAHIFDTHLTADSYIFDLLYTVTTSTNILCQPPYLMTMFNIDCPMPRIFTWIKNHVSLSMLMPDFKIVPETLISDSGGVNHL